MIKVMLDAGHYGKYNRSPAVPEYYESDMTWKLHLLLKKELEKYGIEVGMTRTEQETDLEVYQRGKKAKGYDMLISLHSNAVGSYVNESIIHPIVYRLTSDNSGFADKLSSTVEAVMQTGAEPRVGTRLQNDGITEYYGVLRGAKAVGCKRAYIAEHSFHTATKPTRWLLDDSNLASLAAAEAEAIAGYFNLKKEEDEEMTQAEKKEFEALKAKVSELKNEKADKEKVYHYYDELPAYCKNTIMTMHQDGIFAGAGAGDMNLSQTKMEILFINAKTGVYGKRYQNINMK